MSTVMRFCRLMTLLLLLASASNCWAQKGERSYLGPGNWFVGIDVGNSLSLAENVIYDNFFKTTIPSGTIQLGRTLTPNWSVRLTGGVTVQMGNASAAAVRYLPDMFTPYKFALGYGTADIMLNLANVFRKYDSRNWYDGYLVVGGGEMYRFYVDEKVDTWYQDIYPVERSKKWYWTAKIGYEAAFHIMRECDLTFELDFHTTPNEYNGVTGGALVIDFFITSKIGIVYYLPNGKHRHRFANPKIFHRYWTELN